MADNVEVSQKVNVQKVRKVIEDTCAGAGTTIAIEERSADKSPNGSGTQLHVTYVGERPMPYAQWFKLVDSIDTALDPLEMIDWESSELSEEDEQERMAAWTLLNAS